MEIEQLKYVVGQVSTGKPAYMRFYDHVCESSAKDFISDFMWLKNVIKPSKIIININSDGGSVIHGMGIYSTILNSSIETETIVDGLAASIASVIWAAGTRSYMRDYSILMIHNPFLALQTEQDESDDTKQMLNAFKNQIETVYIKRFGFSQEKVRDIMDGKEGCDGTWFNAKDAVEEGIITNDYIIATSKQVRDKVKNQISGLMVAADIQKKMASINKEISDFKPLEITDSIPKQKIDVKNYNSSEKMKEQENELGSVCAQLGLDKTAGIADVVNSINALKETSKQLENVKNEFNALKIQKEGIDAQLTNVTNELQNVKAELQTYKDAETAKHNAEIAQFIDAAIKDGKIKEESKSMWVEMAQTNFEMVKNTLDSIDKQEKISQKIAGDPANVNDSANGMTEAEKRMQEAVAQIVGEDFKFNKLD